MANEAQLKEKLRQLCLLAAETYQLLADEPHAPALTLAWDSELKKIPSRTGLTYWILLLFDSRRKRRTAQNVPRPLRRTAV